MRSKRIVLTERQYVASYCLADILNYTRHIFRGVSGRQFIVGEHHRRISEKLMDVISGKCQRLIINIAPRFGKTELAVKSFISYGLALNPSAKFIHLSYSGALAQDNSVGIKDIINSEEYQRLFPNTRIKVGSDTKSRWDTTAGGGVYATSTLGQVTGFGAGELGAKGFAGAIVIDDPIKPEDALSDVEREKVNRRFETTVRSRINSRETPIIIIMQRLHEHDLCGYLNEIEPNEWDVLSLPCIYADEQGHDCALWPYKFSLDELEKIRKADTFVFDTQYMQNPKPLEGLMYREFRTYDIIPNEERARRKNYTDSADTGADFHCSICYVERPEGIFVTDVLYTKKAQEFTEPAQAQMLAKQRTDICYIESNNGGRAFSRNVERLSREYGNNRTQFVNFSQTKNKDVRIFSAANEVSNLIFMPTDWEHRWPEFARDVKAYRKEGRNAHDDAPDALSGIIERHRMDFGASDADIMTDFL